MTNIIIYFIQVNICLLILGLVYYTLLRNETDFRFRRIFILGSIVVAFAIPLFDLATLPFSGNIISDQLATTVLPEFVVGGNSTDVAKSESSFNLISTAGYIYLGVAFLILQYFLFQIGQIIWFTLSSKSKVKNKEGYVLIHTNGTLPTFSFFNLLFFDNSAQLSPQDELKVLNHEKVHIKQLHTIDILLLEGFKIINWINPIAWYYRSEIQEIHEYLADDKVIKNTGAQQYSSLLAKMALSQAHLAIGHHFNKSKTLKRIEMMKTAKHKIKNWKLAAILPAVALVVFAVACSDEVADDIDNVMLTASQTEIPADQMVKMEEYQAKYPNADFVYIEADASSEESMKRLKELDPNSIAHINVDKERNVIGAIINQNGPIQSKVETESGVFTIVDNPATPQGGYKAFYERLSANLKYPEQAKKEGVEGKVYVQFVVDKDGSLTDLKVVKGLGAGCDAAALAALQQEGAWTPPSQRGKAVKQKIILPITFSLGNSKETSNG